MSRTNATTDTLKARPPGARRPTFGILVALLAWLALFIAPVAAQAMTRIDPGVPGAVICSVNKSSDTGSGGAFVPHCQLCTLAQQPLDAPPRVAGVLLHVRVLGLAVPAALAPAPSSDAYPGHPPRAPPLA